METTFDEVAFIESEHMGGQHKTYQANCSECHRERRLIQAKRTVSADWDLLYPDGRNRNAISRVDEWITKNPNDRT